MERLLTPLEQTVLGCLFDFFRTRRSTLETGTAHKWMWSTQIQHTISGALGKISTPQDCIQLWKWSTIKLCQMVTRALFVYCQWALYKTDINFYQLWDKRLCWWGDSAELTSSVNGYTRQNHRIIGRGMNLKSKVKTNKCPITMNATNH